MWFIICRQPPIGKPLAHTACSSPISPLSPPPSLFLSIALPLYLSTSLPLYLSVYLFIYKSIHLSICVSVYLSIYLSIYLSRFSFCIAGLSPSSSLCCPPSLFLQSFLTFSLSLSSSLRLSVCLCLPPSLRGSRSVCTPPSGSSLRLFLSVWLSQ